MKGRIFRRAVMAVGLLYFAAVAAATVISVENARAALPEVELAVVEDGVIDTSCLGPSSAGKLAVQTVEREEGPWGSRYLVKEVELVNYARIDLTTMYVFGATKISAPIVKATSDPLSDGQEVRIKQRKGS